MWHSLHRLSQWFWEDEQSWVPREHCPICGREIEGSIGRVRGDFWWWGRAPTKRDALIDHCPVHGRRRRAKGHRRRR